MIENDVESYLGRQVKKIGGLYFKFTSPGTRGVPDRIILFNGRTYFVELKRPGRKRRKDQIKMAEKFAEHDIKTQVIDNKEDALNFVKKISGEE